MYMERLNEVIAENQATQKQARELNTRAGDTVFSIMSQNEWKAWLSERLNGARCSMEIVDFDALRLAELDTEKVAQVLANNPDTIELDGITLTLEYGKSWGGSCYCKTTVEEMLARSTQAKAVVLPGGRQAEIQCNGYSAMTFLELAEKIEKSRIEKAWSEKRREVEKTSWISDPEKVFPFLVDLLSEVVITKTSNGEGDPIVGFISLYSDSDPDFQIRLRESKDEAEKETKLGLERLLKKASGKILTVPDEAPWKSGSWSRSNTDLGNALKARFESLATEHAEGLTAESISVKIEALKTSAENAKSELAGEYLEAEKMIQTTEEDLDSKIQAVEDTYFVEKEIESARDALRQVKEHFSSGAYEEVKTACCGVAETASKLADLYTVRCESKTQAETARDEITYAINNLKRGEGSFNEATVEEKGRAKSLSKAVSDAMYDHRYDDVLNMVKEATELMEHIKAETEDRKAARQARFPESVWEAVGDDEHAAEKAVELAKAAADLVGLSRALDVFDYAVNTLYGRQSCQETIGCEIWQLHKVDIGSSFLNMTRAHDFDRLLRGATAWMTEQEEVIDGDEQTTPVGEEEILEFVGSRNFKCSCGCLERVTKSEMRDIKEGASLKFDCIKCGKIGIAQLEGVASKEPETNNEDKSEVSDSEEVAGVAFTFSGKRYFKCGTCNAQERVSKSEMQMINCGTTVKVTCSGCGASGPAIN